MIADGLLAILQFLPPWLSICNKTCWLPLSLSFFLHPSRGLCLSVPLILCDSFFLSLYLFLLLSVYLSLCLSFYLSLCIYLCLSLSLSMFLSLWINLCVRVCMCVSLYLSRFLSRPLSVSLSLCFCLSLISLSSPFPHPLPWWRCNVFLLSHNRELDDVEGWGWGWSAPAPSSPRCSSKQQHHQQHHTTPATAAATSDATSNSRWRRRRGRGVWALRSFPRKHAKTWLTRYPSHSQYSSMPGFYTAIITQFHSLSLMQQSQLSLPPSHYTILTYLLLACFSMLHEWVDSHTSEFSLLSSFNSHSYYTRY